MDDPVNDRNVTQALRRGFLGRCPCCGEGRLFGRFLKTVPACTTCGQPIDACHRADDAPPYFTMLLVGHLTVPMMLAMQMETRLPDIAYLAIWLPVTGLLALALLQPIKGAVVGLQWALRMHGFETPHADPIQVPQSAAMGLGTASTLPGRPGLGTGGAVT